uniref:Uncharacterized protein n=1 Tax=Amphimedon queenslandica TaxID=400682 RepID=A0A1X7UGV5_AMPQE
MYMYNNNIKYYCITVYGIYFAGIKFRDLTAFFYSRIKNSTI